MARKKFEEIEVNEINKKWFDEIEVLQAQLEETEAPKERKKIEKSITKFKKMIEKSEFWGKVAEKTTTTGEKLQRTGNSMTRVGLKTTAAVWTPAVFGAYKVGKALKDKPKEDDLITVIKECQQAHKDGKITEDEMKQHILEFTNNYYK